MVCGAGRQQIVYCVIVAAAVIEALADLDLAYPKVGEDKLKELATAKKKLLSK